MPGTVNEHSGSYDPNSHTLSVQYEPYWGPNFNSASLSFFSIGNVTPTHPGQTEFEKFASRLATGADNVNAFALQAGLQAGSAFLGRAIGLGIEASLASRAARPYVKVVINWAHRLQDVRPGHLPPPGTREKIQAAVETAIQSERYTTDANGVMNGITDIHGIEVGFTGKQIGEVISVRTVFRIR